MRRCAIFILMCLTGVLLLSQPAMATPWVEKIKILEGPNGDRLFLEKFYAYDGWSAPVSVQIKNQNGAIVAFAPVAEQAAVFCPSIQTCIVYPNSLLAVFATGWRLDRDNVDFDIQPSGADGQVETMRDSGKDYKSYLLYDDQTTFYNDNLGNPTQRLGAKGFKPVKSFWWSLVSVVFILGQGIVIYPLLAGLGYVGYRKREWVKAVWRHRIRRMSE